MKIIILVLHTNITYFRKINYSFIKQKHYAVLPYSLELYLHSHTLTYIMPHVHTYFHSVGIPGLSNKLEYTEKVLDSFSSSGRAPTLLLTLVEDGWNG